MRSRCQFDSDVTWGSRSLIGRMQLIDRSEVRVQVLLFPMGMEIKKVVGHWGFIVGASCGWRLAF